MTIKELIEKLKNFDQNIEVGSFEYSGEEGGYFSSFDEIELTEDEFGNTVVGIY